MKTKTGASDFQPTILLLGTGHWANPNRDYANPHYDDMLSPQRQQEIGDVIERLKRFRPTKIALEVGVEETAALNDQYQRYRGGSFSLSASEHHQLSFRLAAELDHEQLYGIDRMTGTGDLGDVYAFAQAHQPAIYTTLTKRAQQISNSDNASKSVRALLLGQNDPVALQRDHQVYLMMAQVGLEDRYVGIEWVKGWYERNLMIFANLMRLIETPGERILVIYGAGHIPLLAQFIRDSGCSSLETVGTYLE